MRNILLITSVLPWPLRRNGGAQRTALLRDALARHGKVDVLLIAGQTPGESLPDLTGHNVVGHVLRLPASPKKPWYLPGPLGSMAVTVAKYASNYQPDPQALAVLDDLMRRTKYDLIVSRYLQPAVQSGVSRYADVPAVLDFDDIDWMTLASQMAARPWGGPTGKLAARRTLTRVTSLAQDALGHFDRVFVTCEEDAQLVPCETDVLPNIPFSADPDAWLPALPPADGEELLFVGDLQFPPNRDGLDHFLTAVWPKVRALRSSAVLSVVGRGLSEASKAKWSAVPGVAVVGFAEDLQACYQRCVMTVVPIYFGGGTKIKIVESLAYGRAVITVPQSMRGYAALEGHGVFVARSDNELAGAVATLLADPAKRNAAAAAGRAVVERHFSPAAFAGAVDRTIQDLW